MIAMADFSKPESGKKATISSRFQRLQAEGRLALMPFLMAGDPDLETTAEVLLSLERSGADMVELGIPYSDPLADGPVIQAAASRALASGTTPARVLQMLAGLQGKLSIPVILFTYTNPLLNSGMESFCDQAAEAGVSGLVVPDLPLEEAERLSPLASARGLDLVLLVAPTTPAERMARIAETSRGFTYLVSVTGVTGERSVMEERVESLVQQLKLSCSIPIAVGFGISGPEQVRQVRGWGADGAIVGSALVKRIAAAAPGFVAEEAGRFCKELRKAAG
jgi:tryptophan synthase alpha chain|tara:strand:+ start:3662 stop:4498 length:837 start_codon:yes stop_codon:yes gene_type:complete